VPPLVEAKRGSGRAGSGVGTSPRSAVAFIGASARPAKTPLKTPPPFFFSSSAFGIGHSIALVYGTGRLTSRREGAVRIRHRNAMGRPPVRFDVDVAGFPRPAAPALEARWGAHTV
jgi:hypothetical protein